MLPPLPIGTALVDRRVEVWWGGDATWYAGTIKEFKAPPSMYTILYDDGIEKLVDLSCLTATPCRLLHE
jgi:hypothetical protein